MLVGERLKAIRESKGMSQGDRRKRNGPTALLHLAR
jgi:hypothetical protein